MILLNENQATASLYEVCEWFVEHYPDDIFVSKDHPVHRMRDLSKDVLKVRDAAEKRRMKG